MNALLLAVLLTDFSGDLPKNDANATVSLRFVGIRAEGNVIVQLQRRDGQWTASNHVAAADYNQKSANTVEVTDLKYADGHLTGTLNVTIGPDSPRPGVKGFPNPADKFEVTVNAKRQPGQYAPYLPDTLAFMPPWRKDEPQFGGDLLAGKFTAKRGDMETTGEIQGAINPAPVTGKWGAEGNIVFGPAPGGGVKVLAHLAPKRVAPPCGARLVKLLEKPVEVSALKITIASAERRDDAAMMLAIKPVGGGWRSVTSAGLLLGREETFNVNFDAATIEAIALGVDNAHGVGDIEFIVRRIEVLPSGAAVPAAAVTITIAPALLNFAGTTEVPKGLFGFHDVSPPKVVDDYLRALRPGFLRQLEHTGFGGKPATDDELKAKLAAKSPANPSPRLEAADAVDNVIVAHTQDLWNRPSWMDGGVSNTAASVAAFYRNLAANGPGKYEVWNEPFMWGRHINMGAFNPKGRQAWTDPTQYGFLPGKLGADAWSEIFLAAAAAKTINPYIQLGGPSAPAFNDDNYGCFENYVARIIDRCGDKLDFLTEHHYGGDPRVYAASYEVAAAYCETKLGKRLPVYNTEANDLGASSAGKAAYNIADILTCLRTCPDIAKGRALHALWSGKLKDEGEEHAYRLLAPLRGQLLSVESSDPGILVTGALTTNTMNEIIVVALNNTGSARAIAAPYIPGYPVCKADLLIADQPGAELQFRDTEGQPLAPPAAGKTARAELLGTNAQKLVLPARSAVCWKLVSPQFVRPAWPTLTRDRYFSDIVLKPVTPTTTVTGKIAVANPKATRAVLRVITRDVHEGEAVAVLNGHEVVLPYSSSNDGAAIAQDIAIDPSWLAAENKLEFRCRQPESANGFTVYAACLLVDR